MSLTRRRWLQAALAASAAPTAAASPAPTAGAALAPAAPPWTMPAKTGLRIKSVETFTQGANLTLVRITADDGSQGYGQTAPFDADITATFLHRKVAPLVLGADPADLDRLSDLCIEQNYKFPWSFVCRSVAGIDTALWDLLGRRSGQEVCAMLGGQARPLAVYGSSMSRTITPAQEAERMRRLHDEKGYTAFKVRVGKPVGHDQDQWPGRTEELIPAVRKAVGDQVHLKADANSGYSPRRAIQVGRLLERHGCTHYEEPCPFWELEQTAEVAAALDVPVAGGEQDNDLAQWRRMLTMKAVDIAQPDVCYVGGLTRALRVAMLAAAAGLPVVPHSSNPSLVTVFTLHLVAALKNAGPHVEFSIEDNPWTQGLFEPALEVKDGRVAVPAGPGWGVRISPAWLDRAARQVTERR